MATAMEIEMETYSSNEQDYSAQVTATTPNWVTRTTVGDASVMIYFNCPRCAQVSFSQRINKNMGVSDAIQTAIQKVSSKF